MASGTIRQEILSLFTANNLTYCYLRDISEIDSYNDLHILVGKNNLSDFISITELFFKEKGYCEIYRKNIGSHSSIVYAFPDRKLNWFQIDFQTDLIGDGIKYIKYVDLIKHKIEKEGISCLPDSILSLSLILHCVFDKNFFQNKYKIFIAETLGKNEEACMGVFRSFVGDKPTSKMIEAIRIGDFEKILKLRSKIIIHIIKKNKIELISIPFRKISIMFSLIKRLVNPKGLLFVFAGTDGTGKSTNSFRVSSYYNDFYFKPVHLYFADIDDSYLQRYKESVSKNTFFPGKNYLLPSTRLISKLIRIRKNVSSKNSKLNKTKEELNRDESRTSMLLIIINEILLINYFFEFLARYWFRIYPLLVKNNLVFADRYLYDIFVMKGKLIQSRYIKNVMLKLIPEPALSFILYDEPNTIFSRKPDNTPKEISRQNKIYIDISENLKNSTAIKTFETLDSIQEKMFDETCKILFKLDKG